MAVAGVGERRKPRAAVVAGVAIVVGLLVATGIADAAVGAVLGRVDGDPSRPIAVGEPLSEDGPRSDLTSEERASATEIVNKSDLVRDALHGEAFGVSDMAVWSSPTGEVAGVVAQLSLEKPIDSAGPWYLVEYPDGPAALSGAEKRPVTAESDFYSVRQWSFEAKNLLSVAIYVDLRTGRVVAVDPTSGTDDIILPDDVGPRPENEGGD